MKYQVTFERIGRSRPESLVVTAADEDELTDKIVAFARGYLLSRDVEVVLTGTDGVATGGFISCGFQSGGDFTIERLDV